MLSNSDSLKKRIYVPPEIKVLFIPEGIGATSCSGGAAAAVCVTTGEGASDCDSTGSTATSDCSYGVTAGACVTFGDGADSCLAGNEDA